MSTLKIEDFEIVRELGRGGMGVVYEVIDHHLGRRFALKVLHLNIWDQDVATHFATMAMREASKVAKLFHPSIPAIYEYGKTDDFIYLLLEHVEAPSLSTILEKERIPIHRAVNILFDTANALSYLHEAGVVHRDIKP